MRVSAVQVLRVIAEDEPTDAELLGRFVDRRDEAAFAVLVRRHGAMVYGVCRRLLPEHDAEDAFQATFLVLAQKARTAAPRQVAGWLYGVAHRAALLSRRAIARRRERTGEMPDCPAPEPMSALRAALDEELSRLPDIYRLVIVLCDLEGRTRREAAAVLGCPEGTVAGRLVRAREILAKRMARHAPVVSLAAVLAGTATARVPEVLSPTAAIPPGVAALTREVLAAMTQGKLMKVAVAVLLLGCAGFGMVLQAGQDKPAPAKDAPLLPGSSETPINPPKADDVAWGKEVDGLQIGLTGVAPTYRHGEKARMEVKLRNVGKADVKITHSLLREHPPQVTAAGVRMTVAMPPYFGAYIVPTERRLKPGETITLYNPEVAVESTDKLRLDGELRVDTPTTYLAPGKYKIAFGGMIQSHPKLSTGAMEFEVKDLRNEKPRVAEPDPDVQEVTDPLPIVHGPLQKDGSRKLKSRKDVVGQPVRVEGIAWGQPFGLKGQEGTISPHAGPHVVYEGGSVFVKGIDFTETKARGKPVRVTGTLRFEPKTIIHRWGDIKGYYYIEATGFETLDAVTDPHLVYLEK